MLLLLGVSLLLWLHSPGRLPVSVSANTAAERESDRASERYVVRERSISSSVDDAVCLRWPPV